MPASDQQTPSPTSGSQAPPTAPGQQSPASTSGQTSPQSSSSSATGQAGGSPPASKAATGQTTLDDKSGSLVGMVALKGLGGASTQIAAAVGAVLGDHGSVLIVEDRSFAQSDAPHAEISARLDLFRQRFEAANAVLVAPPAPPQPADAGRAGVVQPLIAPVIAAAPAVTAAATSVVGLAAEVIGMFKSDYSVQGRGVTFDYAALAAAVAQKLIRTGKTVVIDGFLELQGSPTFAALNELLENRAQLEALAQRRQAVDLDPTSAEIDTLNARIKAATDTHDKAVEGGKADDATNANTLIAQLRAELAEKQSPAYLQLKADLAATTALIASFDQYITAMAAVPTGQTYPPLVAAALRDVLHAGVRVGHERVPVNYVLYIEVTGAGGDMITRTGLFSSNRKVGLVGAVQATYILIEPGGRVRASDSIGSYSAATFDVKSNDLSWQRGSG